MCIVPQHPYLRTEALNRAFNNRVATYKFYWFLALLELSRGSCGRLALDDIFVEMAAQAWHPVNLFRLAFDTKSADERCVDKLQGVLREIAEAEAGRKDGLRPNSDISVLRVELRRHVRRLRFLGNLVPKLFLRPFVEEHLPKGMTKRQVNHEIVAVVARPHGAGIAPYAFAQERGFILLNPDWQAFFRVNEAVLRGFAQIHLVRFLQSKNPMVPGIADKLGMRTVRDLARARTFWERANQSHIETRSAPLRNLYTGQPLGPDFEIDHFMPWSYVAHDYIWNTVPTDPSTNASKGDRIPSVARYADGLAEIHHFAIRSALGRRASGKEDYTLLADYMSLWRLSGPALLRLSLEAVRQHLTETLKPLEDQAPVEFDRYRPA